MAKSIFDYIYDELDFKQELIKIKKLFSVELIYDNEYNNVTLEKLANRYITIWPHRNGILSVSELKTRCGIDRIDFNNISEYEAVIYLEYVINMLLIISKTSFWYSDDSICKIVLENIKLCLESSNKEIYNYNGMFKIIEKDINIKEAVAKVEEKVALPIIRYRYITNEGNIKAKQLILKELADDFESKRGKLNSTHYKDLASDLGFLFNTFNIRHNNDGILSNNLEIEKIYDLTYNLYITAVIGYDYITKLKNEVERLKSIIIKK